MYGFKGMLRIVNLKSLQEVIKSYRYKMKIVILADILGLFFCILAVISMITLIKLISFKDDIINTFLVFCVLFCSIIISVFILKKYNFVYIKMDYKNIFINHRGFNYRSFNIEEDIFVIDGDLIKITSKNYEYGQIHLCFLRKVDKIEFIKSLKVKEM